jgi:hypothetical protein
MNDDTSLHPSTRLLLVSGSENISGTERSLIEVAAMARGCSSLILSRAGQYGVVEQTSEHVDHLGLRELPKLPASHDAGVRARVEQTLRF